MQCSLAQLTVPLGLYIAGIGCIVFFVRWWLDLARSKRRSTRLSAEVRELHDQAEARALRFMVFQYALWLSAHNATVCTIDRPTGRQRVTQIVEQY